MGLAETSLLLSLCQHAQKLFTANLSHSTAGPSLRCNWPLKKPLLVTIYAHDRWAVNAVHLIVTHMAYIFTKTFNVVEKVYQIF